LAAAAEPSNGKFESTAAKPATRSAIEFLKPLELSKYAEKFDEEGGDHPVHIERMTEEELVQTFGMARLHARTLRRWLDTDWRKDPTYMLANDSVPATTSMPATDRPSATDSTDDHERFKKRWERAEEQADAQNTSRRQDLLGEERPIAISIHAAATHTRTHTLGASNQPTFNERWPSFKDSALQPKGGRSATAPACLTSSEWHEDEAELDALLEIDSIPAANNIRRTLASAEEKADDVEQSRGRAEDLCAPAKNDLPMPPRTRRKTTERDGATQRNDVGLFIEDDGDDHKRPDQFRIKSHDTYRESILSDAEEPSEPKTSSTSSDEKMSPNSRCADEDGRLCGSGDSSTSNSPRSADRPNSSYDMPIGPPPVPDKPPRDVAGEAKQYCG